MPTYNNQYSTIPMVGQPTYQNGYPNMGMNQSMMSSTQPQMTMHRPELVPQNNVPDLPPIPAKQINNYNDIRANDVPMDGTISLFMMGDCSRIIAKQWNSRGTIDEVCYVPEPKQEPQPVNNDILQAMMDRLDSIESMLRYNSKIKKPQKQEEDQHA